jgi:hypothetical protein
VAVGTLLAGTWQVAFGTLDRFEPIPEGANPTHEILLILLILLIL